MTRTLVVKHLRAQPIGTFKYRRRVPTRLIRVLGKQEFVKVLGKSEEDAIKAYAAYHDHVEKLIASATRQIDGGEPLQTKASIESIFAEAELDPYGPGKTEMERLSRSEEADRILSKYPIDDDTGQPLPSDLSSNDHAMVVALLNGLQAIKTEVTITQAFAFYLSEKQEPDPYKRNKQISRFKRAEQELLRVTKQDIPIDKVTRAHARALRDLLQQRLAPSSVRRNINDVKAVFNMVIREYDLDINNPFNRLDCKKDQLVSEDVV